MFSWFLYDDNLKNRLDSLSQDFNNFLSCRIGMLILQCFGSPGRRNGLRLVGYAYTAVSTKGQGAFFGLSLICGLFPIWLLVC